MVFVIYAFIALLGLPFLCYGLYNLIIGIWGFRKHTKYNDHAPKNRICAVIAARNEEVVIGNLIDSLKHQDYPAELMDVYVLPNNCTDNTEGEALAHGAKVYHCTAEVRSKGAALEQFFDYTVAENDVYDAFCIFDADNLVDPGFYKGMNNALCDGELVAQGYRDSKNPGDSWISGSQSIFYWLQNRFMNLAKQTIGWSAALNGTGFMVAREVIIEDGFRTHTLTEDIEFTVQNVIAGRRVAWVPEAKTYDEHPLDFNTSWKQRKRWSTGILQCFLSYGPSLWRRFRAEKSFMALDMFIYLSAPLVQVLCALYSLFSTACMLMIIINTQSYTWLITGSLVLFSFGILFSFISTPVVALMEKQKLGDIKTAAFFSFWVYIFSWIPINVLCVFSPITTWEPIAHTKSLKLSQLNVMNIND